MNQSELEANTLSRQQARENACEQDTIGFVFTWLVEKVAQDHFSQSRQRVVMQIKPKQLRNYFRHSIETALYVLSINKYDQTSLTRKPTEQCRVSLFQRRPHYPGTTN